MLSQVTIKIYFLTLYHKRFIIDQKVLVRPYIIVQIENNYIIYQKLENVNFLLNILITNNYFVSC